MITRDELARRLDLATVEAIRFARTQVIEELPDRAVFHLRLVPTYPDPKNRFIREFDPVFTSYWRRSDRGLLKDCSRDQVIDELWHDGRAPEWIDIGVDDVDERHTHVGLRFSRTLASYFDLSEPRDKYQEMCPFNVKGPPIPRGHVTTEKFRLRR